MWLVFCAEEELLVQELSGSEGDEEDDVLRDFSDISSEDEVRSGRRLALLVVVVYAVCVVQYSGQLRACCYNRRFPLVAKILLFLQSPTCIGSFC